MTWPSESDLFVDLLAICSDAPSPNHRMQAAALLARELKARLALGDRSFAPRLSARAGIVYSRHFAWDDLPGGPKDAGMLLFYSPPTRHRFPALSVPQATGSQSTYSAELAAVTAAGDALVAESAASMVDDEESKALLEAWIEYSAGTGPHPQTLVTDTRFNVFGRALGFGARYRSKLTDDSWDENPDDPADRWRPVMRMFPQAGYQVLGTEIAVPAPGMYRVQFEGRVRSSIATDPTPVVVELWSDDSLLASYTVNRESDDPDEFVSFNTDEVLEIDGLLSIVNGGLIYEGNPRDSYQHSQAVLRISVDGS